MKRAVELQVTKTINNDARLVLFMDGQQCLSKDIEFLPFKKKEVKLNATQLNSLNKLDDVDFFTRSNQGFRRNKSKKIFYYKRITTGGIFWLRYDVSKKETTLVRVTVKDDDVTIKKVKTKTSLTTLMDDKAIYLILEDGKLEQYKRPFLGMNPPESLREKAKSIDDVLKSGSMSAPALDGDEYVYYYRCRMFRSVRLICHSNDVEIMAYGGLTVEK